MRYIFMDEAGTSAREPVTVVLALIANADKHIFAAERLVEEIYSCVPSEYTPGFVFHATEVFSGSKTKNTWRFIDRLEMLKQMMSVPRKIGISITVSAVWRNAADFSEITNQLNITQAQFEHMMAFGNCLAVTDRNIRRNAEPNETATAVVEDVPEMRTNLKNIARVFRESPMYLKADHLRETPRDREAGYSTQSGDMRISRIRKAIHFVDKDEDPLVQVADACAFGIRRFLSDLKFGDVFAESILGSKDKLRNFSTPSGAECWWHKNA